MITMTRKQPKTVTKQMHRILAECGLSRYEIAKRSGVSEATLSRFVNRQQGLSTDTLDKLAEVLNLELTTKRPKRKAPAKKGG